MNSIIAESYVRSSELTRNAFKYTPGNCPSIIEFEISIRDAVTEAPLTLENPEIIDDVIYFDNTNYVLAIAVNSNHLISAVTFCVGIWSNAFVNSTIKYLKAPELITIGQNGFNGCINLTQIYTPLLEVVYTNGFLGCVKLRYISCPNLDIIHPQSLTGCNSLREIYFPVLTDLGDTGLEGYGFVFTLDSIYPIKVTIPSYFLTSNAGSMHEDLQWLVSNNDVTLITV